MFAAFAGGDLGEHSECPPDKCTKPRPNVPSVGRGSSTHFKPVPGRCCLARLERACHLSLRPDERWLNVSLQEMGEVLHVELAVVVRGTNAVVQIVQRALRCGAFLYTIPTPIPSGTA